MSHGCVIPSVDAGSGERVGVSRRRVLCTQGRRVCCAALVAALGGIAAAAVDHECPPFRLWFCEVAWDCVAS